MKGMCGSGLHKLAWVLLVIGGLNWGLVGLFDWNLVNVLFGNWMWLEKLVYILVGLSAILALAGGYCKMPSKGKK